MEIDKSVACPSCGGRAEPAAGSGNYVSFRCVGCSAVIRMTSLEYVELLRARGALAGSE